MVRISYPHLFTPHAATPGDPAKFGASFLVPKTHEAAALLVQAFAKEKANKFGATAGEVKNTLYDGDSHPQYSTVAENRGHYILSTSSQIDRPPPVYDAAGVKLAIVSAGVIYAGCFVNAEVGIYANDRGVFSGLNGVQFAGDGTPLGNVRTFDDMFGAPTGAPPPIATGVAPVQPIPGVAPQPVPAAVPPTPPVVGVPPTAPPVAAQPAGVPPVGVPSFLG